MALVDFYKNLLIIQYHDKPKAKATIGAIHAAFTPVNSATGNLLWDDIRDAFDIETAVGVQLDIIGQYIGTDRFYKGTPEIDSYGFTDELGTDFPDTFGMSTEATFLTDDGTILGVDDIISLTNRLDDDDYRFILKLKIAQNQSNHSCESIDSILYQLFGNDLYYDDNLDMTMTYHIAENRYRLIPVITDKKLWLKPMGVAITGIYPIS